MNLGDKILQLRKKNGLSQEQLGEKVDVTRQTISNWELGETTPNPEQLKKMSKAFNVSIDEILDNDSKEFLMNKISNTEKLAGIIIKILKVIGFVIVVYIIFMIIVVIGLGVFTVVKNG
uniref:helix-turn-helix domain-containing protein n=1 Tax=Candidatus Ventrenecus sp. TaxID=3085654 RepID=UPI004029D66F